MSEMLGLAEAQLASNEPHSSRVACWLGRSALEELIDELLAAENLHLGPGASARSKLTCLEVAYEGTQIPGKVQYAWSRLSEACHHHACELAPTYSEATHLIEMVGSIEAEPAP